MRKLISSSLFIPLALVLSSYSIAYDLVDYSSDPLSPQGYLCLPEGTGPFPAVVYHHGGKGDGKVIGGDPIGTCEALADAGFVGFSPIRRGIEPFINNGGTWSSNVSISDRMGGQLGDAEAGVDYIRNHPKVDSSKIGMIGFSFGGMESLILLSEKIKVNAAVIMAPADPDYVPPPIDLTEPFGFSLEDVVTSSITAPMLTMVSSYDTGSPNTAGQDITVAVDKINSLARSSGINLSTITYDDPAGHNMFFSIGSYWEDVIKFLSFNLGVSSSSAEAVVGAATDSAIRFTKTSMSFVNDRMAWLRGHKDDANKSVQGINIVFADPLLQQFINGDPRALDAFKLVSAQDALHRFGSNPEQTMADIQELPIELAMGEAQDKFGKVDLNPTDGAIIGDWYLWTAGQVTIGKYDNRSSSDSNESKAINLSIGMDKADADSMFGFAVTGSKEMTDIGTAGSKQKFYGLSLSFYSSINPENTPPLEFILGVGRMNINSTRIDGPQTLTGLRNANTVFGSVGVLAEPIKRGKASITPYSKLEAAYINLGSYSEAGGSLALAYDKQTVKQAMVKLGFDASYDTEMGNGKLTPFTRLEYAYEISPRSNADMHYVGDSTNYRLTIDEDAVSVWSARVGADYMHNSGASTGFYYERSESINSGHSDAIQLKLSIPF